MDPLPEGLNFDIKIDVTSDRFGYPQSLIVKGARIQAEYHVWSAQFLLQFDQVVLDVVSRLLIAL